MTAMLEGHLARCDAALAACAEGQTPNDLLGEWPLKRMLSLMKMSTQLAGAIARLDARAPKNLENRGSIPQQNCA
jgi:hypothetical protein